MTKEKTTISDEMDDMSSGDTYDLGDKEAVVMELLPRVRPDGLLSGHQIRNAIIGAFAGTHGLMTYRYFVRDTIAWLEQKGVVRRVHLNNKAEWKFEEKFLQCWGHKAHLQAKLRMHRAAKELLEAERSRISSQLRAIEERIEVENRAIDEVLVEVSKQAPNCSTDGRG